MRYYCDGYWTLYLYRMISIHLLRRPNGRQAGARRTALTQPLSGFWRIACCEPCCIRASDRSQVEGVIWNLSVVGAYVVLQSPRPEGDLLSLSFTLPGDDHAVEAQARVVWQNRPSVWPGCGERSVALPPGCGVEFTRLEEPDATRIEERVRKTYPGAPLAMPSARH